VNSLPLSGHKLLGINATYLVDNNQFFEEPATYTFYPKDGKSRLLKNITTYQSNYTARQHETSLTLELSVLFNSQSAVH
jgi:hypothetical protein